MEDGPDVPREEPVAAGALFEILADARRRHVLYCLERFRTPIPLADLADEVAVAESDANTIADISDESVKRVYMDLYHAHVPKMADAGVVAYDQASDTVDLTSDLGDVDLEMCLD